MDILDSRPIKKEDKYITPAMESVRDSNYDNFFGLDSLFSTKKTFGERVGADIQAVNRATNESMSTTQKVLIGVGFIGLLGAGWFVYKKIKSGKKVSVSV